MTAEMRSISDGVHGQVTWRIETLPSSPEPGLRLLTLTTWHGPGRRWVAEQSEIVLPSRGTIVRLCDDLVERLRIRGDAAAAKLRTRRLTAKAKAAGMAGTVLLSLAFAAPDAAAQTVTKYSYDVHGQVTGRAELRPDGSVHYFGPTGRATGRSETRSDGSVHDFDEHGQEVGTVR